MDNIKEIVQLVVKNIADQQPQKEKDIQRVWEEVAGKKTAQATHIVGIKHGKLLIVTDSSIRLFDLTLHKRKFLNKLQEEWPELSDISFKIGKGK